MSEEELVRRLRNMPVRLQISGSWERDCYEAADEIVRLRDQVDLLTQQLSDVCTVATEGFEIVAGKRQCVDNLMGNADVAEYALRLINALKGAGG